MYLGCLCDALRCLCDALRYLCDARFVKGGSQETQGTEVKEVQALKG